MKLKFILLLSLFSAVVAGCAQKDYVVAADESVKLEPWSKVVDALCAKHNATVIRYDGKDSLPQLVEKLKTIRPKYVCFVSQPEKLNKEFIAEATRSMRTIDTDPYADAIWGVITAYSAEDALRIVNAPASRTIRSMATSMGGPVSLDRWESGIASDERTPTNLWVKVKGGKNEKIATDGNIAKSLAWAFNTVPLDYFVTSGHATEHGWQIIYNKNNGNLVHTPEADLTFVEPGRTAIHPLTNASLRVYIGAGNCLIGHVNARACMATAWMKTAGVEQFAGYTVPSWYGFMGWGVKGLFECGRYSLPEAFFLENQRLVWTLGREHPVNQDRGLNWDRDTFAFYGDPAQSILFPEDTMPYSVKIDGRNVAVSFNADYAAPDYNNVKAARPVMTLLEKPVEGNCILDKEGKEVADSVVTENFMFIPLTGNRSKGETLNFTIGQK